jgi:opacity protein-like surface antigen
MYFVTEGDRVNGNQRRMFDERRAQAIYYDKLKYWGDSDSIRWFGRVGLAIVNTEVETRIWLGGNNYTSKSSHNGIVLKAGAGLQLRVSDTWHVRTELENYFDVGKSGGNMPKTDITVFSVGVLRLF